MNADADCMFETLTLKYDNNEYEPTTDLSKTYDVVFDRKHDNIEPEVHSAHKYSYTLPKAALNEKYIMADLEVNRSLSDYIDGKIGITMQHYQYENVASGDITEQNAQVTASIAKVASTYSVTIPESVTVGELSATELVYANFDIDVKINKGNDNLKVILKTEQYGEVSNGTDTIEYESYLGRYGGEHYVQQTCTIDSPIYFYPEDVVGKSAGNYTGTMSFDISTVVE